MEFNGLQKKTKAIGQCDIQKSPYTTGTKQEHSKAASAVKTSCLQTNTTMRHTLALNLMGLLLLATRAASKRQEFPIVISANEVDLHRHVETK